MAPKIKVSRQNIIAAAVEIVRGHGAAALNARDLAAKLGCSTQPIFSNFPTMEELKSAVLEEGEKLYGEYMERERNTGKFPPYKASGMAYIRFAKEEKELFKLLYMRDRTREMIPEETDLTNRMEDVIQETIGLDRPCAKLFHLEMWAYVHGIAVMVATGYFDPGWNLISKMLTDCYQGLKKQFEKE